MKKSFFALALNLMALISGAQGTVDRIDTDRPDQTESATLVPKGWLQAEAGLVREQRAGNAMYTLPTLLSKYGLLKKLELRLITEYTSLYQQHFTDSAGLMPVLVGFKYNLFEEKGVLPKTSLIAHTGFSRLASRYFKSQHFFVPEFRFTMQHTLTQRLGLGYNMGAEWSGADEPPVWIYTLAPGLSFAQRWYAYVELFGGWQKGQQPDHSFDGGLAYYLSDNVRVDVSGGIGLTKNSLDHYVGVGFSMRMPASKQAVR